MKCMPHLRYVLPPLTKYPGYVAVTNTKIIQCDADGVWCGLDISFSTILGIICNILYVNLLSAVLISHVWY